MAPQPVAPVVESLANSRPKRYCNSPYDLNSIFLSKKEESQIEQVDLDDDEIYSQSLATTSSKSKKQRK